MTSELSRGAGFLLRGFVLLRRPRILPFVVVPLLINIALFYFGIYSLYDSFSTWLNAWLARIPEWLDFIRWILWPLFAAAMLLLVAFGFTLAANLIGSPFYGLMAEQVELIQSGKTADAPLSWRGALALVPRALLRELAKLGHYLRWLLPLLLLSLLSLLITPLATLMPVFWFLFGAWMLAIQYVDYSYDNHQRSIGELKKDLRRHRWTAIGFGGATTLASMVPVLNILVVPAAVCGAVVFWLEQLDNNTTVSL